MTRPAANGAHILRTAAIKNQGMLLRNSRCGIWGSRAIYRFKVRRCQWYDQDHAEISKCRKIL